MEENLSFLECLMPWTENYKAYERQEKEKGQRELSGTV